MAEIRRGPDQIYSPGPNGDFNTTASYNSPYASSDSKLGKLGEWMQAAAEQAASVDAGTWKPVVGSRFDLPEAMDQLNMDMYWGAYGAPKMARHTFPTSRYYREDGQYGVRTEPSNPNTYPFYGTWKSDGYGDGFIPHQMPLYELGRLYGRESQEIEDARTRKQQHQQMVDSGRAKQGALLEDQQERGAAMRQALDDLWRREREAELQPARDKQARIIQQRQDMRPKTWVDRIISELQSAGGWITPEVADNWDQIIQTGLDLQRKHYPNTELEDLDFGYITGMDNNAWPDYSTKVDARKTGEKYLYPSEWLKEYGYPKYWLSSDSKPSERWIYDNQVEDAWDRYFQTRYPEDFSRIQ